MKLQLAEGKLKEDNTTLTDEVENLEKDLRHLMNKEQQESEVYHCMFYTSHEYTYLYTCTLYELV